MSESHTRESDEKLLIQFVADQGWDDPELVEAAERLKHCIAEELQDYSTPADQCWPHSGDHEE